MEKKVIAGIVVVIVLLVGLGAWWYWSQATGDNVAVAYLNLRSGTAEVNRGQGWQTAADGAPLSLNDKVRTSADGKASIVLYESVVVDLGPGTEITVKSLDSKAPSVGITTGSAWSKFTKTAGVVSYSIDTPNGVATVRGTGFWVDVNDEETNITVGEGTVDFTLNGQTEHLNYGDAMAAGKDGLRRLEMDGDRKAKLVSLLIDNQAELKRVRRAAIDEFISRNRQLVEQVKNQYGVSESQIDEALAMADRGEINEDDLIARAPVKLQVMYRLRNLNKVIREQQALIDQLQAEVAAAPATAQ